MKNLKYIMATLMVALVVAVVFVGCKKEKETPAQEANNNSENEPNTEVVERKPIAVFDKNTGVMTTLIDVEQLNMVLKETNQFKGDSDRFVIESVTLSDTKPLDNNSYAELKVSLLDLNEECSYTIWLMKECTIKEIKSQNVEYRLSNDFSNNEYSFGYSGNGRYYIGSIQNNTFVSHEVDSICYGTMPKWFLACRSSDCENQCEKVGNFFNSYCKACPLPDGDCNEDLSIFGWVTVAVLAGIVLLL